MRIASTNGVDLAVHDLGGGGEPLLIAHATGFCGRTYEPLAVALRSAFHVWAVDFRGHGDSTAPSNGDFAWTGMGDDALAALVAVAGDPASGGRPIVGFGHSMGGAALLSAERARPGLLRSAWLFEPIIPPDEPVGGVTAGAENPLAAGSRRRRPSFPSKAEALLRYARRPPLSELRADTLAAYVEHGFRASPDGGVELKCRPEDEARTFEAPFKLSVGQVRGLALPTTVAVGGRIDPSGPASLAPAVVEALTNATLATYPRLGHFGPLQDPQTIAEDLIKASGTATG